MELCLKVINSGELPFAGSYDAIVPIGSDTGIMVSVQGVGQLKQRDLHVTVVSTATRKSVPAVAANLISTMKGKTPRAPYNSYMSRPFVTGYGSLVMVVFERGVRPQKTFLID